MLGAADERHLIRRAAVTVEAGADRHANIPRYGRCLPRNGTAY